MAYIQLLDIAYLKSGQPTALSELKNYQSHQSFEQAMLKIILNKLKPKPKS